MSTVVTLHRSSWPQSLGLPQEVRQTTQDLPFKGSSLFSKKTYDRLHGLKDSKVTLKSLGLYVPTSSRKQNKLQKMSRYFPQIARQDQWRRRSRGRRRRSPNLPHQALRSQLRGMPGHQSTRFHKTLEVDITIPSALDPAGPLFSSCLSYFLDAWTHTTSDSEFSVRQN